MKTFSLSAAALLSASIAGILLASCTPPMPPPPPPGPRGRSLDVPPRYGVPEQQTRYFDGADLGDPSAVQPPNPDAPLQTAPNGTVVNPPVSGPSTGALTAPPPVVVSPPGPSTTPPVVTPPVTPPPAADIPFATRISGKPGFVKSPFDPSGQAIDVRDFQSGQKAKCPYTGKVFRVP